MPEENWDLTIIGGGIVGLAAALELLTRRPGLRLAVLEKEPDIARHQSGHNSGVIHSGVYYAPGSLKARACVAGRELLLQFCDRHAIPYRLCGKLIVATEAAELPRLAGLYERATANGVPGLELVGPERLREIEPHMVGVQAVWVPGTGIVDFAAVARKYAELVRERGGTICTGREVQAIARQDGRLRLATARGTLTTRYLISCAGLQADRVAQLSGAPSSPRIVPFRGDYYVLRRERRELVRGLVYPVPDPRFPFLGVHFTPRMDGAVWLGPNAVLAFAREGYRRSDVRMGDLREALGYGGFQTLARRYWRVGLAEMYRDWSKTAFLRSLQRYLPALRAADLEPGPSGVRAQALAPDGTLVDDFVIDEQDTAIHVRNAPSPAATSSLAIGAMIADAADARFGLAWSMSQNA